MDWTVDWALSLQLAEIASSMKMSFYSEKFYLAYAAT